MNARISKMLIFPLFILGLAFTAPPAFAADSQDSLSAANPNKTNANSGTVNPAALAALSNRPQNPLEDKKRLSEALIKLNQDRAAGLTPDADPETVQRFKDTLRSRNEKALQESWSVKNAGLPNSKAVLMADAPKIRFPDQKLGPDKLADVAAGPEDQNQNDGSNNQGSDRYRQWQKSNGDVKGNPGYLKTQDWNNGPKELRVGRAGQRDWDKNTGQAQTPGAAQTAGNDQPGQKQ